MEKHTYKSVQVYKYFDMKSLFKHRRKSKTEWKKLRIKLFFSGTFRNEIRAYYIFNFGYSSNIYY